MITCKKILALLFFLSLGVTFSGCSGKKKPHSSPPIADAQDTVQGEQRPTDISETPAINELPNPDAIPPVVGPGIVPPVVGPGIVPPPPPVPLPVVPLLPGFGHGGHFRDHDDDDDHDHDHHHDRRRCDENDDCGDRNPCTTDECEDERCVYTPIPGCSYCDVDATCLPGPVCTEVSCVDNACTYTPIAECIDLVSIAITPLDPTIGTGDTQQFVLTGTFSDTSTANFTAAATWTSSNPLVASISNVPGTQGLAEGLSPGTTTITATFGNLETSTTLTVTQAFAFVTNAEGSLLRCDISGTGFVSNCVASGATLLNGPGGGSIANSENFFYFANSVGPNFITQCTLNPVTGVLSGCVNSGAVATSPRSLTINNAGTFAYIADDNADTVLQCAINAVTGALSGCISAGATLLDNPQYIALNDANTLAYITNFDDNNLIRCSVATVTGDFFGCVDTGVVLSGPVGVAINEENNFIYISNETSNTITQCEILLNGDLTNCVDSGATGLTTPNAISLNSAGNRIYVTDRIVGGVLSVCEVNSVTGALSNCVNSGATGLSNPLGVSLLE
jgi:DNA-binding beta-propeller fold protein YncE